MTYDEALQCIRAMEQFDRHQHGCKKCKVGTDGDVDVCKGFNDSVDRYNQALRAVMDEIVSRGLIVEPWELSACKNSLRCRIGIREISLSARWVGKGFDWLWWIWDATKPQRGQVIDTGMTKDGSDLIELLPHAMELATVLSAGRTMHKCPHRKDDVTHDDECYWCHWRVSEQGNDDHDADCSWLRLAYTRCVCKFDPETGNHLPLEESPRGG